MTESKTDIEKFKSDIKKIRISLITLTFIEVIYFVLIFSGGVFLINNNKTFSHNILIWILSFVSSGFIIGILHFLVMTIIIWYNWKKMPIERKKKIDNTLMILFLGILGMWFWLPNKMEFNKLIEKNTTHNTS